METKKGFKVPHKHSSIPIFFIKFPIQSLFFFAVICFTLLVAPMVWAGGVIQLPQTGQTTCYYKDGTIINCSGTGQDGDIKAGAPWPTPRFVDNYNGTIADNLSGLTWLKDANIMKTRDPSFDTHGISGDGAVTWQKALDYIKKLNIENYLGYNNWRLPNVNELESLLNIKWWGQDDWLKSQGFLNFRTNIMQSVYYWSSSSCSFLTNSAWFIDLDGAYVSYGSKTNYDYYYVWPVRTSESNSTGSLPQTGQTICYDSSGTIIPCASTGQDGDIKEGVVWPSTRFEDNADQTMKDNLTGLVWTKDGNAPGPDNCGPGSTKDWMEAFDYIRCLNSNSYLGYNDWRLPNRNEIRSLVNYSQANTASWLVSQGFANILADYYWSSSSYAFFSDTAWSVNLGNGSFSDFFGPFKSGRCYVWPVVGLAIPLTAGWNLISVPYELTDKDVTNVLANIKDNVEIVWGFTPPDTWVKYGPTLPSVLNTLTELVPGKGYWIKLTATGITLDMP